jgi:acrylyl-CoA reductase (NADPH)
VNLLGIDSVCSPTRPGPRLGPDRQRDLPMEKLEAMVQPATLADLPAWARRS